ncbi:hypothetical protein, variant [Verruconis gallopava]|uniref:Uncharacterized protein n=1 Tax=Verruconis gallopava TaxID=253628 RepID=A0A0D2A5S5_9PEZI|nr:uncharacterized protein PV09_06734 [Verruconis gallopava]XP_016211760.1 hypothetical protein, variant [Verruconis gallopava]KIW01890.1 hypothetical protein PV09_06734 [Verruconis gallopava]KIW01891.1 hypothetical protein, variant [Verruconis gallopava]
MIPDGAVVLDLDECPALGHQSAEGMTLVNHEPVSEQTAGRSTFPPTSPAPEHTSAGGLGSDICGVAETEAGDGENGSLGQRTKQTIRETLQSARKSVAQILKARQLAAREAQAGQTHVAANEQQSEAAGLLFSTPRSRSRDSRLSCQREVCNDQFGPCSEPKRDVTTGTLLVAGSYASGEGTRSNRDNNGFFNNASSSLLEEPNNPTYPDAAEQAGPQDLEDGKNHVKDDGSCLYDSDEGLFVPYDDNRSPGKDIEDGDVDAEGDAVAMEIREDDEFSALETRYKDVLRQINEKKAVSELSSLEEVEFLRLEKEYLTAAWRRQNYHKSSDRQESEEMSASPNFNVTVEDVDDSSDEFFNALGGYREMEPTKVIDSGDYEHTQDSFDQEASKTTEKRGEAIEEPGVHRLRKRKRGTGAAPPRKRHSEGDKSQEKDKEKAEKDCVEKNCTKEKKKGKRSRTKAVPRVSNPLLNIGSLLTSNIIHDARGNENLGTLPVLSTTNRSLALKRLVASLPPEHRAAARIDKRALLDAMRDFSTCRSIKIVPGEDGGYLLKGMVTPLKPHQLTGAAFMRRREKDTIEPRGGICGDQMGLGKTVTMIANILDGMPSKGEEGPKTTLIVATNALVHQWYSEIEKHTKPMRNGKHPLKVLIYTHKTSLVSNSATDCLLTFDAVLTTYSEVRKSYPKSKIPVELQTAEEKKAWWNTYYEANRGLLHRVKFLRVVLDEAQHIKNHKSHTFIASFGLEAEFRWALSGTPIQNSAQELYPYFKFLRVEQTGSHKIFCHNYIGTSSTPSELGLLRLNQILNRIMIRRTHRDKVLGKPIVTLPKATEQIRWVKFNALERTIYELVRSRMIKHVNQLSRSRKLEAHYRNVLTMLLRLRQLTDHVLLVETVMRDLVEREDYEKIYDLALIEGSQPKDCLRIRHIRRIRAMMAKGAKEYENCSNRNSFPGVGGMNKPYGKSILEPHEAKKDSDDGYEDDDDLELLSDYEGVGGSHGLQFNFLKYLKTLRKDEDLHKLNGRAICAYCGGRPEDPHVTSCYHIYCSACLELMMTEDAEVGLDGPRCRECGAVFTGTSPCDSMDFDRLDRAPRNHLPPPARRSEKEGDGEDVLASEKEEKGHGKRHDWIDQEGDDILPSAKTVEIKAQILNWIAENPKVKIVVFTQFLNMIRILEKVCRAEGWGYTSYHGSIPQDLRQHNIERFRDEPQVMVLLMSLKTGGVGLNLTMAQKVIIVDPWWNSSVEQQAFCRVFRIGQDQQTSLTRLAVEHTVDQNIIEMQQRKQEEIDLVIDGKPNRRLNIKELLELFGDDVGEDEDGQPFIMVKDQQTRPNPWADDEGFQDEE